MKMQMLSAAACAMLATSTQAGFQHLSFEIVDVVEAYQQAGYATIGPINTDLDSILVYHVYAEFFPDDNVVGIGEIQIRTNSWFVDYDGIGASDEGIPSSSGGFIPLIGDIVVDSFITINELQDPGGATSSIGGSLFPDFRHGTSTYRSNGCAAYGVAPSSGIGETVWDGGCCGERVLLAQVIIADPQDLGYTPWIDVFVRFVTAPEEYGGSNEIIEAYGGTIIETYGYCLADVSGPSGARDGTVGVDDFFALLQNWGTCPDAPEFCPGDLTGYCDSPDGEIGVEDFFLLLQNWGDCP